MRIDLHTHSTVSDGTGSPAQVIREAAEAGLDVVALADHDSTAGWDEAQAEADALGIELVPAIEISAKDRWVSIHLLAYWPRRDDPTLVDMMEADENKRGTIAEFLNALGLKASAAAPRVRQLLTSVEDEGLKKTIASFLVKVENGDGPTRLLP